MVRILISRSAERELARLPRDIQERFARAFEKLEKDPRPRPGLDIRPLRGFKGAWRLRVGSYRGIYEKEKGQVRFTRFGHRRDVYRF
ncbi:MAG: type II toxin-antitoxin system RelE/ParE family toxin [Euryarchaeota archaeon]|nr:type II toxin-antitoxin system RelE/ParE family toxin [Euryarchaeota archaeon]